MTLRIAVCDDENSWINHLENHLVRLNKVYKNITWDVFYSGEQLLDCYTKGRKYDVLIADIELDGINGIELSRKIRKMDKKIIIIFLTNYDKYIRDCFECAPSGFLDKPVSYEELKSTLERVAIDVVNSNYFTFKNNRQEYRITYDEILYLNSDKRKIVLHTLDTIYEFWGKLKDYKEILLQHGFVITHNSFCVNPAYIVKRTKSQVTLSNGDVIPISNSCRENFENTYLNFVIGMR